MFKKHRAVAWTGFSFLTCKRHISARCQGPVVTAAPSQQKLWGGGVLSGEGSGSTEGGWQGRQLPTTLLFGSSLAMPAAGTPLPV